MSLSNQGDQSPQHTTGGKVSTISFQTNDLLLNAFSWFAQLDPLLQHAYGMCLFKYWQT